MTRDKRTIKFLSRRIKICQWCVSFLCNSPINPDIIESDLKQLIYNYISNLHEHQIPSKNNIRNDVIREIGRISIFDNLFLYLFKNHLYKERQRLIEEKTTNKYFRIKTDIDNKIQIRCESLLSDVLERKIVPKKLSAIGLYSPRFFYTEIIPRRYIKYINAIQKKLIAGQTKVIRPSDDEWKLIRRGIISEDEFQCKLCSRKKDELHVHHIIPLSKYGTNDLNNLILLCRKCHIRIHPKLELITQRK